VNKKTSFVIAIAAVAAGSVPSGFAFSVRKSPGATDTPQVMGKEVKTRITG